MINFSFWRRNKEKAPEAKPQPKVEPKLSEMKISPVALAHAAGGGEEKVNAFVLPKAAPGVIPNAAKMACDGAIGPAYGYAFESIFSEGLSFPGYPYLSELTQRAEYRRPAEVLANHMTRKWIKLQCTGDEDKTDKLAEITAEFKRLGVQNAFRRASELDGFFGRAQIYIDTGSTDNGPELKTALVDSAAKIGKGSLKRLVVIEPIWTYPNAYNSTNPLAPDYFKPGSWFVMGQEVHTSRLLTFVSREVPDLLKPAYSFGGLSLSQMAKPYVDNWLRTRQAVSDLVSNFSVSGIKTNMASILNGGAGEDFFNRMQLFNQVRNNRGLMALDKDTEEFFNISVPLSGLDSLQAQAQEHMAAVTGIPLAILLGITPTGLNASSEGEIRIFEDWISAKQNDDFTGPLTRILNIVQLSLYGEIDPEIGFMFEPLRTMDELQLATARKTEADTDAVLIQEGVIAPSESRARLAAHKDSPYASLDLNEEIEPSSDDETGSDVPGSEVLKALV